MSSGSKKSETRKASTSATTNMCKVCNSEELKDKKNSDVRWIQCDVCDRWCHISCVGLDDKDYDFLSNAKKGAKHIFWMCQECSISSLEVMKTVAEMKIKVDKLQKDLEAVKTDNIKFSTSVEGFKRDADHAFTKMAKDIVDLKSTIENNKVELVKFVEEKFSAENTDVQKSSWAKIASKLVDDKLGQAASEVKSVQQSLQDARAAALEEKDRETRSKNLIIYRVPEDGSPLAVDRNKADARYIEQLLFGLELGLVEEDIRKVFRLGRKGEDTVAPRPILVQLGSQGAKNLVMENLFKIKSMSDRFKSVSVAHDMTKKERSECKELLAQAKDRTNREAGEWIYRVRGPPGHMKIVQIRKSH